MGFSPSIWEMAIVMAIALLLFGKRLPEVAKSVGKGIRDFKKGLTEVESDVSSVARQARSSRPAPRPAPEPDDEGKFTAPKFTIPAEDTPVAETSPPGGI